jgi:hypothetical protein
MLVCRKCGYTTPHDCGPSTPGGIVGSAVKPCPLKGALWVHVVDLAGNGVEGVKVKADGAEKTTDKSGFAIWDPLDEGAKKVELQETFEGGLKHFYKPDLWQLSAAIAKGQVSLVEFQLPCWIEIRVEDDKGKVLDDVKVLVKGNGGALEVTLSKDMLNDQGVYRIGDLFPGESEISFPEICDAEWSAKA